jgi:hypothetical protein
MQVRSLFVFFILTTLLSILSSESFGSSMWARLFGSRRADSDLSCDKARVRSRTVSSVSATESLSLVGKVLWVREVIGDFIKKNENPVDYLMQIESILSNRMRSYCLREESPKTEGFARALKLFLENPSLDDDVIEAIRYSFSLFSSPIPLTFLMDDTFSPYLKDQSGAGDDALKKVAKSIVFMFFHP